MPEGDTIHQAAINLRKVLQSNQIEDVHGRPEVLKKEDLTGTTVTSIEARGKHLIIHFNNGYALQSHMGMTGSWHLYPLQHPWQKPKNQAAVVLKTSQWYAVCFSPKQLRIITERELLRDPWLQRLGPDILGPPIADEIILNRFRTQNAVPIGEAVMNQTVVSGIGNIYKSETLFLEQIHPLTPVAALTDDQLLKLRDQAVFLMKRNLNNTARQTRFRGDKQKLWVYARSGKPCPKCGTTIQMIRQGNLARSTYLCPECQPQTNQ